MIQPSIASLVSRGATLAGMDLKSFTVPGSARDAATARIRFAVILVARNTGPRLQRSYPMIGARLGRHHTSVMDGHRRARQMMAERRFRKLVSKVARG